MNDENAPLATPPATNPTEPSPLMTNQTPATTPEVNTTKQRVKSFLATLAILLIAPLIAVLLTVYVFQSYQVDGASMQTTLSNNDRLIVWKLPRTWARVTGHGYVPKRGDVIIFNETGLTNLGQNTDSKQLIKRVIGLPGDRIVIKDGTITIYNSANPTGFAPDVSLPYGEGGRHIPTTSGNVDLLLGKDQVYVCGDNRGNSLDSRVFGPINTEQIVGKLVVRVLPLSEAKRF
ncbi:MAG: signal peptidase I [Candidatus Saccharimonadales bacterium]